MKKITIILFSVFLISCHPRFEKEITVDEIKSEIGFLASDSLKGRYPGTPEDKVLTDYIAHTMKQNGLLLYQKTGKQEFDIVTDLAPGPSNSAGFNERTLDFQVDFIPVSFSANGSLDAGVVFVGYGFDFTEGNRSWNDYRNVDVNGKWVMILRGTPPSKGGSSPYINYSEDRGKSLLAEDHGAAGVILVSGKEFDPEDELIELRGKQHPVRIPVIQLTRNAADELLLSASPDSIEQLETKLTENLAPVSFSVGTPFSATVDLEPQVVQTSNVISFLKGSDPGLREQYVIIGAHHDHLGWGGEGSSSRRQDTVAIHNGADDNASGVAGVLEISENLVTQSPRRSFVFVTFGAEEMGLIGSKYFVENSPVDLAEIQAMINIDMVGRLNEDRLLQIGGVGTSPGFKALLDSLNSEFGFNLKYSNEGYGPSDHASFYAKDIPVLFFSTGAHPDYHTPEDDFDRINYEGVREVYQYIEKVAEALANKDEKVPFKEAGPKVKGTSRGRYGKITLGLMPDVTYDGNEGMPVMFVTEGKPAAVGGIHKGDTIVAIEGKPVGNVYDYMSRLNQLKEGTDIVVSVKRDGSRLDLVVRL